MHDCRKHDFLDRLAIKSISMFRFEERRNLSAIIRELSTFASQGILLNEASIEAFF
jgi:hypothetical protein